MGPISALPASSSPAACRLLLPLLLQLFLARSTCSAFVVNVAPPPLPKSAAAPIARTRTTSRTRSNVGWSAATSTQPAAPLFAVEPKAERQQQETALNSNNTNCTSMVIEDDDDDDDEYEYIEYDVLTEAEFVGSEWLVGTNWDNNPQKIAETWVRLAVQEDGKQVAVWGDGCQGTWKLDAASQFLSISKENVLAGKEIWACTVSDYYHLQGTVRGWKYWSAAAVMGQWQAKRLGCDPDEAGTPPWLENADSPDEGGGEPRKVSWKGEQ